MKAHIDSDGKTVWVNGEDGCCIGRFSKFGIDVHHPAAAQIALGKQCLDCTHEKPDLAAWVQFKESMWRHFLVIVGDQHMPEFLKVNAAPPKTAYEALAYGPGDRYRPR